MLRRKAYQFRLKPTPQQAKVMAQTAGVVRLIWNSALALQKERLRRRARLLNYAELCRELTQVRQDVELAFVRQVHSKPQQQVLRHLCRAFKDFFAGEKGFPRFKRKGVDDAFRHPERVSVENRHVKIPGLGLVRMHKSREVEGTLKNATVKRICGHWYVSLQVEEEMESPRHPSRTAVGIDMGVSRFTTLSDGEHIDPANAFRKHEAKLRKAQRKLAKKRKRSSNWRKQKARVARIQHRIAQVRNDFLHKTSTCISKNHALVCIEDLKVRCMSRSAKGTRDKPGKHVKAKSQLNKSILDQGWGEFRRQLEYKQEWLGGLVVAVPPRHTSQTCHVCGYRDATNRTSQSHFACGACGYTGHADFNAACVIKGVGQTLLACGESPLGPSRKQEPEFPARGDLLEKASLGIPSL